MSATDRKMASEPKNRTASAATPVTTASGATAVATTSLRSLRPHSVLRIWRLTFDMSGRPRLAVGCPLDGMVRPTTVAEGANWQSKNADLIEGTARTAKRSTTTCGDSFGLGLDRTAPTLRETERPIWRGRD